MANERSHMDEHRGAGRADAVRWASCALACGALMMSACVLPALDAGGKACPCPLELQCEPVLQTCVSVALDLSSIVDAGGDAAEPLVGGLASLVPSAGRLSPAFDPDVLAYQLWVPIGHDAITVTANARYSTASLLIDGVTSTSGTSSAPIDLRGGPHMFTVAVVVPSLGSTLYQITVVRSAPLPLLSMPATGFLGAAIATSGDTLAVGARAAEVGGTSTRDQVHVFRRDAKGTWSEEQAITAPVTCIAFGDSVALSVTGAAPTLAVSCSASDNTGNVRVYIRVGTTWMAQATLTSSNLKAADLFPSALALSGDTLVATAIFEASNAKGIGGNQTNGLAPGAGAAYVFVRDQGTQAWHQQAYIKASNTDTDDYFGGAVALDGDTLVVGAAAESSAATGVNGDQTSNASSASGAAYVFVRSGTTWTQQAYLKAYNTNSNDAFGSAIALEGDRLALGARGEASGIGGVTPDASDNSASQSGAVYVFSRSATTWTQTAYVKALRPKAGAGFGSALTLHDNQLLVGAPSDASAAFDVNGDPDTPSGSPRGAAYLFRQDASNTWQPIAFLKANDNLRFLFGSAMALGDGWLIVGAPFSFTSGAPGSLYRFDIDP